MLSPIKFVEILGLNGINAFYGVPDSLLKHLCSCLEQEIPKERFVTCANEGNAIAMSAGHYLGTGNPACVFMQNSGEGNAINPLLSLNDPDVYGIPSLLVIGWRGQPGIHDEPQHVKQGKATMSLLEAMGIPWWVLPDSIEEASACIEKACRTMRSERRCCALIVQRNTFEAYPKTQTGSLFSMAREDAITTIINGLSLSDIVVSTTGFASRELFECRERSGAGHSNDFLTVGSMGHCSSIALGLAMARPERRVWCIDGDGSFLMHMGGAAVAAASNASNFRHVVLNNQVHDSVGAQPIGSQKLDYELLGKAFGYRQVFHAKSLYDLESCIRQFAEADGPSFMAIDVKPGARKDLGRPTLAPREIKRLFMAGLGMEEEA